MEDHQKVFCPWKTIGTFGRPFAHRKHFKDFYVKDQQRPSAHRIPPEYLLLIEYLQNSLLRIEEHFRSLFEGPQKSIGSPAVYRKPLEGLMLIENL